MSAQLDETDFAILELLQGDARLPWKEIGQRVHLTGQAVAARIRKLEETGVLEGFTVKLNTAKLRETQPQTALVTVFMKSAEHAAFQTWLRGQPSVLEAHRISGEGCYWLKVVADTQEKLTDFLDSLLVYGNYRVNLSIQKLK